MPAPRHELTGDCQMEPATATPASSVPALQRESTALRKRRLAAARRRATALLVGATALIVERKDQFAATLGQFVQENFLNADVLDERIRSASLVARLAAWLADEANAARFAGHVADLGVNVAEALRDEDVQRVLTAELTRAVDAVEVAPLAGRALRMIIAGGHHAELFNAIVAAADRYLAGHQEELR